MSVAKVPALVLGMFLAVAAVATLAYWDEQAESEAARGDFAQQQITAARAVSAAFASRLAELPDDAARVGGDGPETAGAAKKLLEPMMRVEHKGTSMVLLRRRDAPSHFLTTDGEAIAAPELDAAIARGDEWLRLSRDAAASLGLPRRTAIAGLGTVDASRFGNWIVAVVQTAQGERDREIRARWRLLLAVAVASSLVVAFGGLALRRQRLQLELARELAVAEATRRRDEELVRADKLATMGALATGIAHEVSTPLAVIVGRAEQLESKIEDDRGKRAVSAILEQSERISRIVRGFLLLARGDAPPLEHVSPELVARAAVELVEHRFAKAGVVLRSDVTSKPPPIACEPRLFEQALVNLLLNACDACEPGGHVEICVRDDGERVAFVITDNGSGIPPDVAARAIEPFFTTKPAGKGTGLGLAIANEIVKHHRGVLSLRPAEGGGTRACVEVPAAPV